MKVVQGRLRPFRTVKTGRVCRALLAALTVSFSLLGLDAAAQVSSSTANTPTADEGFRYDNLWELSGGLGFASMPSGHNIPMRAELAEADVTATQWITPRLGATADVRTYAGLGNTNVNPYTVNSPLFVETFGSVGPEYRWVRTPAIGVSLHALAGGGYGVFNYHVPAGVTYKQLGNYPNSATFDVIAGANFDFNTPSGFGVRVSPNLITTDFDSDFRSSFTVSVGLVYRYGRF